MFEVEVKVPGDHDHVRQRLDALGASSRGAVTQIDTYYDHPNRSFSSTDEALRVRQEPDRAVLTYKGPKVDMASKTRREIEIAFDDPESMDGLLRAVGFEPAAIVRKTRERFAFDGYSISLDTVEGLGEYIEVEAAGDEPAIEGLRDGAHELLDRLGLDPSQQIRRSYLELLADA